MALKMRTECERCHVPLTHMAKGIYLFLRMHLLPGLHGFDRCDLSQLRWRIDQAPDPTFP